MTEIDNKQKEIEKNNKVLTREHTHIAIALQISEIINNHYGNNWFDRVYLCYEDTDNMKPTTYGPIIGFKCYRYTSFENADKGWDKDRTELHKLNIRHTMIPICKWVPKIFDKYILNWKLKNIYWLGIHTIGSGYNRYK
jgi:hypothetical protein